LDQKCRGGQEAALRLSEQGRLVVHKPLTVLACPFLGLLGWSLTAYEAVLVVFTCLARQNAGPAVRSRVFGLRAPG
jgi:hypothetical protein